MRKSLGIMVAVGAMATVACSSTAGVNRPVTASGEPVEQVSAPEILRSIDPEPRTDVQQTAPVSTQNVAAAAAEEAFVATISTSTPPESEDAAVDPQFGPGVSQGVIRIGATLRPKLSALNATLYRETERPDFKTVWRVVTNAINSTGGILGRRLEVVFLPQEDPAPEVVCTFFTEEEAVIAAVTFVPGATPCLDDAGIVTIPHTYSTASTDFYRRAPHALLPLGITLDRANRLYIDGLYQQGFFNGDHKIGLIRWDTPTYERVSEKVVKPALARYGLEVEEEVLIVDPETEDQVSDAQNQGWNGVQTFKDAGVDRVLTLDSASYILPEFTDYAEAQGYHPRYGLNSLVGGEWDMERNQLKGAVGIGWMPWLDLEPDDAYRHGSEGARRCADLMAAADEEEQMDTYNEAITTSSICDAVLLLKAAIEAGGPSITAGSIVSGAESLGTSFQASNSLLTRFAPGRHEGVAAIRFLRWFVGCECFRYTSDLLDAG